MGLAGGAAKRKMFSGKGDVMDQGAEIGAKLAAEVEMLALT